MSEPGKAMMGTAIATGPDRATKAADAAVACPLLEGIDLSGAKGVLVLIAASRSTFKLSESKLAMNTIRRYAAEEAHVIFGTAYDESLGDQLRVTVIATGLSQSRRAQAPLTVIQTTQALRTGTDNLPMMNAQMPQPMGNAPMMGTRPRAGRPCRRAGDAHQPGLRPPRHAQRLAPSPARRGQGRGAELARHGRDRDPGVPAQAGGLKIRASRDDAGPRVADTPRRREEAARARRGTGSPRPSARPIDARQGGRDAQGAWSDRAAARAADWCGLRVAGAAQAAPSEAEQARCGTTSAQAAEEGPGRRAAARRGRAARARGRGLRAAAAGRPPARPVRQPGQQSRHAGPDPAARPEGELVHAGALPARPATSRTTTPAPGTPTRCCKSFKDGTEEQNREREKAGVPALEIVGWSEPPRYDAAKQRLVWAMTSREIGAKPDEPLHVNYNTYALGRDGYFSMNMVTSLAELPALKPVAEQQLAALDYNTGKRYADFDAKHRPRRRVRPVALVVGVARAQAGLHRAGAGVLLSSSPR